MSDRNIVNGPLSLYFAAVGTAFPLVDDDPPTGFTLIGTSGAKNYTEDGVSAAFNQSIEVFRGLGSTTALKAFRTEEDLVISVQMADLTLAEARRALNENAVTNTPAASGVPGTDEIRLDRGVDVNTIALLVRGIGKSAQFEGGNLQFEFDKVYEAASQEMTFVKGEPAGVLLEFHALEDDSGNVGRWFNQTAVAL
ncbi:hypothetical protein LCGC14_2243430 [marine sediment metagenome]|uniref:Uncharacterized protein n=1 Tax=marine sediment metagenome TaxID=412755 RepID=A0A0F9DSD3_9ZZZZ